MKHVYKRLWSIPGYCTIAGDGLHNCVAARRAIMNAIPLLGKDTLGTSLRPRGQL